MLREASSKARPDTMELVKVIGSFVSLVITIGKTLVKSYFLKEPNLPAEVEDSLGNFLVVFTQARFAVKGPG